MSGIKILSSKFVHKTPGAELRELDIMFALTANPHQSVVLKITETNTLTYLPQC